MAGMVAHTSDLLNEPAYTGQGPQFGAMSGGTRPFQQRAHYLLALLLCNVGFAASLALALQGLLAASFPRLLPTMRHLPGDAEPSPYLRRRVVLCKQPRRALPPLLHLLMISFGLHSSSYTRHQPLSPYYASLNSSELLLHPRLPARHKALREILRTCVHPRANIFRLEPISGGHFLRKASHRTVMPRDT